MRIHCKNTRNKFYNEILSLYSSYQTADQPTEASEKPQQEPIAASSPTIYHNSDYNIMHESSNCDRSPEAGNNNVYAKKTNWSPLTPKIV